MPTLSWVAALYSLQNCMMFSPCTQHYNMRGPCMSNLACNMTRSMNAPQQQVTYGLRSEECQSSPWNQEPDPQEAQGLPCLLAGQV